MKLLLNKTLSPKNNFWLATSFLLIGILSRIIPHLPNSTAMAFASLMLGFMLSRTYAILFVIFMGVVADTILAYLHGFPAFGLWSIFTYSGYLMTMFLGSFSHRLTTQRVLIYLLGTSSFFWLWTNFGVWLISGLYSKTIYGLVACYIAALPFLRNEFLGDLLWAGALLIALSLYNDRLARVPAKSS